jgi:uncharacterized damage-inducible protein DinB
MTMLKLSELFAHWESVRAGLLETIDKFEETELAFVPFEGSWPAGQIMLHIANTEDGWLNYVARKQLERWPRTHVLKRYPNKGAIKDLLAEIHQTTRGYLETLGLTDLEREVQTPWGGTVTLGWIIWHVLEHEIHHRGELSLILGQFGREGLDV